MTDLLLSLVPEAGQVIGQGPSAGAAGSVALIPVPGLELAFDRVDGRLTSVVVELAGADESVAVDQITLDERVAALLTRLFGAHAPTLVRTVATAPPGQIPDARLRSPEPDLTGALSRLGRLEAARATSPLPPGSPWWGAEAAGLAQRAGLPGLAMAEARKVLVPLLEQLQARDPRLLPEEAVSAVRTVAAMGAATESATAGRLLAALEAPAGPPAGRPARTGDARTWDVAAEVAAIGAEPEPHAGPHWTLDPALLGPGGPFRPGLSPSSDLLVDQARDRAGQRRLTVDVRLARPAGAVDLSRYRVRVVDPEVRRPLARAPLGAAPGRSPGWGRAELSVDYPRGAEVWIEVVPVKTQSVLSLRGYHTRRALRWADAALRAERAPRGLAPGATAGDWVALAAAAWDRSSRDWAAAGNSTRARLARQQRDATGCRPPADGPACLAELLGG